MDSSHSCAELWLKVGNKEALASPEDTELENKAVLPAYSFDCVYQNTSSVCLERPAPDDKPVDHFTEGQVSAKAIRELYIYLDMVKKMVRPGCSPELLEVAFDSVSSLFNHLTMMSSVQRLHASL